MRSCSTASSRSQPATAQSRCGDSNHRTPNNQNQLTIIFLATTQHPGREPQSTTTHSPLIHHERNTREKGNLKAEEGIEMARKGGEVEGQRRWVRRKGDAGEGSMRWAVVDLAAAR
ncbi:hypothetical protein Droror1_Dr00005039 [Drosera rotundifolia]